MNAAATTNWHEANQRYLMARLSVVRTALERHAASVHGNTRGDISADVSCSTVEQALQQATASLPTPAALDTLCAAFALSPFERDVLLLCAGVELDAGFAALCATTQGDARRAYATFSLALAALPEAHWSALVPAASLRRWHLVESGAGDVLTLRPLRIDERILHYLTGVSYLDERLQGLVEPLHVTGQLPPSYSALAGRMTALWSQMARTDVLQLCGGDYTDRLAIAAAACAACEAQVHTIRATDIPVAAAEREALARLWEREAVLSGSILLIDCDELDRTENTRTLLAFLESVQTRLVVSSLEPVRLRQRLTMRLDVRKPSVAEQQTLWLQALGPTAPQLNGQVEAIVSQFQLGLQGMYAASAEVQVSPSFADLGNVLWEACRHQARARLDDLAQRLEPTASWDDLIIPAAQGEILHEIATHVRQRARVYETWGLAAKNARGLGISALFAGASGTGKTMAAEVLANELRLDLYRIDLSQVVSKYIGETEKNLRRVFDAAEQGGAILLFDEADALFGKRSEIKDSHDRYANIEISYLLQRMEAYRGLAILTTNLKSALDTAFLRRLRFVVQFPFPDVAQRVEIWKRMFPSSTPTEGLDLNKLARLNVAGGHIRNVALNAAFIAADAGAPVRMVHLLHAARSEYAKLEKPLTEAEIGGWL